MKLKIVSVFLVALAFSSLFVVPETSTSISNPSKCHHNSVPTLPANNSGSHRCCSLGHDRALPKQVVDLRTFPAVTFVALTLKLDLAESPRFLCNRLLTDSAGPPNNSPLRI